MSTIFGPEPGWRVEDIQTDERTGACTLELVKPWSPLTSQGSSGPPLPGAAQAANGNSLELPPMPAPPEMTGWVAVRGKWRLLREGGYGFGYSYEGVRQPTAPAPSGTTADGIVWTVRGSFRQRPITTHPNFSKLSTIYEWDQSSNSFPPNVSVNQQNSTRGLSFNAQGQAYSPLYGVSSFDDLSAVLTKTFIYPVVDTNLFSQINTIVNAPWASLGPMPDKRNWKVMPPSIEPHANQWKYEQSYMLSGPGGWNTDIYGTDALSAANTSSTGVTV